MNLLISIVFSFMALPALAEEIHIGIGEPGFYGQIDIGDYPRPALIYAQPVIVQRVPAYVNAPPIYLHVPPGFERHWERHCRRFRACDRPVFFVRDRWYNEVYVPRYRERHREERRDGYRDRGEGRGREYRDGSRDRD